MPTTEWSPELEQWMRKQAILSGFDTAGLASLSHDTRPSRQLTADRFTAWIEAGRAGEMDYLKRRNPEGVLLRSDIRAAIPWAESILVCAFNYSAPGPLSIDAAAANTGWIARYAWSGSERPAQPGSERPAQPGSESPAQPGSESRAQPGSEPQPQPSRTTASLLPTDYHAQLLTRLQHFEAALQRRLPCQTRCYVDTGPLIERAAAAQAGIGWIGKNTCVLNQQLGSWLLLGVIVTSVRISPTVSLHEAADRCGSCTRCIDACPTTALIAPREMDASRCIAYLTIEKKGSIPEELRPLMGRHVFGCDICQDVCPWNSKAPLQEVPALPQEISVSRATDLSPSDMLPRPELINPDLEWLAAMDPAAFNHHFKGSPLERTRRKRILRNVAIAMGNSGLASFRPTLENWASAETDDPVLAEAARWALHRLKT